MTSGIPAGGAWYALAGLCQLAGTLPVIRHRMRLAPLLLLLAACGDDAPADAPELQTCDDVEYGDGTCQLELACGIPDLDCFQEFPDDASAAALVAEVTFSSPLPVGDPLFVRARAIADRVWSTFPTAHAIDRLAARRLSVVVLDDPSENAFVIPSADGEKSTLVVTLLSGLLQPTYSDEAIAGVIAHELGHIVNLHVFPEVQDGFATYYIAAEGEEPIGDQQPFDARWHELGRAYAEISAEVGGDHQAGLGDVPDGGVIGLAHYLFLSGVAVDLGACTSAADALLAEIDGIDSSLALDDAAVISAGQESALAIADGAFRGCMSSSGITYRAVDAELAEWGLAPRILSTETNLYELDAASAFARLTRARRDDLAAREAAFTAETGQPWTAMRWYSPEEQADDTAVRYSRIDPLGMPGSAEALGNLLHDRGPACDAARASGTVPYGVNLHEPHHATCWRIEHAYRYDAMLDDRRPRRPSPRGPAFVPTRRAPLVPIY